MKAVFLLFLDHHAIAMLVILLIMGIRLLMIRFPARIRFYLWVIPTLTMLCPIKFKSDIGVIEMPNNPVSYPLYQLEKASQQSLILAGRASQRFDWLQLFALIWIVGFAIMVTVSIIQHVNLCLKTREKVAINRNVYISDHIESAFVTGIVSGRIILPSNLSEKEKQYIILHERSHIQKKDHLIRLAGWFCVCLCWFNPLVWLYYRMLGFDMEVACDERVLMKLNKSEQLDYSQCLLNQSGKNIHRYFITGFMGSDLKKRVQSAISFKKSKKVINCIAVFVVILSGALLFLRPNEIEKNNKRLISEMMNLTSNELFLNDVIPFGWDELVVFSPDSIFSVSEIESILGIENSFQSEKDYGFTVLVFMDEKEPVAWLTLHPDLDQFVFSFPYEKEKVLRYTSNELMQFRKTEDYGTLIWRLSGIAYTLNGLEEKEQKKVLMLDEMLREVYELDSGLNHDIEYLVMDMEDLNVLSNQGKSVLMGMIQEYTGIKTITRIEAEENENVILTKHAFENGLVFYLGSNEEKEDRFTFSVGKWRSSLGAIFSSNNEAVYKNGQWDYVLENWAIS